jgi:D-alanyl-D-alanine carboxypeptidase
MADNRQEQLAIVLCLVVSIIPGCQGNSVVRTPLEQGISTQLLKDRLAEPKEPIKTSLFPLEVESALQVALERHIERWKLPGAVMAISSSEHSWLGSAGQANVAEKTALQPTDRFRIGGLSEMFLSVVCLQLAEEGVLDLTDSLSEWLPAKVAQQIPQADRIMIQQLLNHTSGLPRLDAVAFQQAVAANPTHRWTATEVLAVGFEPDSPALRGGYSYSTANYLLLELIMEQATGSSLAEVLQDRIIAPLNLKNTFVELSSDTKLVVHGYQDWNSDGTPEDITQPLLNTGLGLGGTALISNAPDLTRFFQAFFFEETLLSSRSRQKIMTIVDSDRGGYGLGMINTLTRWGEIWGQTGSTTGFSSAVFYLPIHDLIVVTWTNSGDKIATRPFELTDAGLNAVLENSLNLPHRATIKW